MDLERLQVVISAKTDQLQKQLEQVVNKLTNVDKTGSESTDHMTSGFNEAAKAAKALNDSIISTAKYFSDYDIFGAKNSSVEPWINNIGKLREEFESMVEYGKQSADILGSYLSGDDIEFSTLDLGNAIESLGTAKFTLEQIDAIMNELAADLDDEDDIKLSSGLIDLAGQDHNAKQEIIDLNQKIQESGDEDTSQDESKLASLIDLYSSLRRQIQAAVDQMGGLKADKVSGLENFAKNLLSELDNVKTKGGEAISAISSK